MWDAETPHYDLYLKYMWDQPAHRSVCSHRETHLKCYTCPDHCCISAFSKRQAQWWGGDRRCKECIAGTEAAKKAATANCRAPDAAATEITEQAAADGAEQAAGYSWRSSWSSCRAQGRRAQGCRAGRRAGHWKWVWLWEWLQMKAMYPDLRVDLRVEVSGVYSGCRWRLSCRGEVSCRR